MDDIPIVLLANSQFVETFFQLPGGFDVDLPISTSIPWSGVRPGALVCFVFTVSLKTFKTASEDQGFLSQCIHPSLGFRGRSLQQSFEEALR